MKYYCDTMLKAMLPISYYPDAQIGMQIKLTDRDIEYIKSQLWDDDPTSYEALYLDVQYVMDNVIIGNLCVETELEVQMGCFNPRDY